MTKAVDAPLNDIIIREHLFHFLLQFLHISAGLTRGGHFLKF